MASVVYECIMLLLGLVILVIKQIGQRSLDIWKAE